MDKQAVLIYCIPLVRPCPFMLKSVPKGKIDDCVVYFDRGGSVIEDCRDVLSGETVVCVAGLEENYVERRQVLPTTPSPTITNFKEIGYIYLL